MLAVVNPGAGHGRAGRLTEPVLTALRSAGAAVRTVSGRTPDETAALLAGPAARGVDAVVAVGGAATSHLALQAAVALGVPLGLIGAGDTPPLGAAVAIAAHPVAAATAIAHALAGAEPGRDAVPLDLVAASLPDGLVYAASEVLVGPSGLVADQVDLAALGPLPPPTTAVALDDRPVSQVLAVAVGTGRGAPDGRRWCLSPGPATGAVAAVSATLAVTTLAPSPVAALVRLLPMIAVGRHGQHRSIAVSTAAQVRLEPPASALARADGVILAGLPRRVSAVPAGVRLLGVGGPVVG